MTKYLNLIWWGNYNHQNSIVSKKDFTISKLTQEFKELKNTADRNDYTDNLGPRFIYPRIVTNYIIYSRLLLKKK